MGRPHGEQVRLTFTAEQLHAVHCQPDSLCSHCSLSCHFCLFCLLSAEVSLDRALQLGLWLTARDSKQAQCDAWGWLNKPVTSFPDWVSEEAINSGSFLYLLFVFIVSCLVAVSFPAKLFVFAFVSMPHFGKLCILQKCNFQCAL